MSETPFCPVIDLTKSPHAAMLPISINAVQLTDDFWAPRLKINREVTIPSQLAHCEATGRIDNFRIASGRKQGEFQGIFFNDSDVYKWLEAASFSLATHPDSNLEAQVDAVIDEIAAAQQPDGYLNTFYMGERAKDRFTNLKDMHEVYCAGHLMQAAVAHHRATGKRTLLDVACRLADHLYDIFGPGKRVGACGHEEAEMALVELYRTTGEKRYLELAHLMIEARGQKPPVLGGSSYHQDHLPFASQFDMTGHAVRMLYLCCGAADVALETSGTPGKYWSNLSALWQTFTGKRMYVTGGAGSRWEGEAFGADYELPNDRAYTETCAAIGSVIWNWRMQQLDEDGTYDDLMEHTLYNAVLPGLSLDGTHYFYQNPLSDRGKHRRQEWFGCACCPPNVARLLASLPGYFYTVAGNSISMHLYASHTAQIQLPSGGEVHLTVTTDYPWNGNIEIRVDKVSGDVGNLYLRIPGWARAFEILQNGEIYPTQEWEAKHKHPVFPVPLDAAGTTYILQIPMSVERISCHPHAPGNQGRIALQRGPLIYCIEQADLKDADVWDIAIAAEAELTPEWVPDLLGGVTVLRGQGIALSSENWGNQLYCPLGSAPQPTQSSVELTAIPYYAWANREAGPMQVWIPHISS